MSAPKMPEIRQTIDRARALAGREDTEQFVLEAPGLLARLVEILDLYVGHEPTLAEEAAYVRGEIERRDAAITEALRLLESAPEAFLGASQNIVAAAHVLRQASGDSAEKDTREAEPTQPGGPFERVTVVLTAASSAALNQASEATGDTKTDTINRALQTYAHLCGVVADGGKVLVQQAEGQAGKDIPAADESTRAVCGQRGSRDAGLPYDLVCMKAAGHVDAGDPWHDMVPGTEAPACGRCHRLFDPSDTRFDGHAQHADTPFCRSCVDRCHESTDAFHQCPVCSGSGEAGESR